MNPRRVGALFLISILSACGGGGPAGPDELPDVPQPLSPVGGATAPNDTPTLVVRNARGYDAGQAQYTFRVTTASGASELASITVPAGQGSTSAVVPQPLPRGMLMRWSAIAVSATASVSSAVETFRGPLLACGHPSDPYAKAVVDFLLPFCPTSPNIYNDPLEALGPPDAGGVGPFDFVGFVSLGEGGHVTVDMEGCATDDPGNDVRVFQAVGAEPVTLYASGTPEGPFVLIESRKVCNIRYMGSAIRRYCEFDLASGEMQEARYLRVEDGELYPCELAGTPSEGADLDAVEILHLKP